MDRPYPVLTNRRTPKRPSGDVWAAVFTGLGLLALPRYAPAQHRIELTPFIGAYYAFGTLGRQGSGVEERQENQPTFGGAVVIHFRPTFGIEAAFAITPSGVNVTGTSNPGLSGRIVFASARARVSMPNSNVYGLGGLGLVMRGGRTWEGSQYTNLSSVAGIVGVGTQAQVSSAVRADLRAELNLYAVDPDGDGLGYKSNLQADLMVGFGIPISLARRTPSPALAVVTVAVDPVEFALPVGETRALSGRPQDVRGRPLERPVTWRSEDDAIARVSNEGIVAGVAAGRVRVVATSESVAGWATVTVTPEAPAAPRAPAVLPAEVAAGGRHTCARNQTGQVWCWGDNAAGQVRAGAGTAVSQPARLESRQAGSLAAGGAHTCGLRDGQASCWGSNLEGQLGSGDRNAREVTIAGRQFTALTAGAEHTCGLTTEGAVLCWGKNDFGQLGDLSTSKRTVPTPIASRGPFVGFAAGARHTCALHRDGRLFCWGDNWSGQVGSSMTQAIIEPTESGGGLRFVQIGAGQEHSCGVTREGRVYCWGQNTGGQLGDGSKRQRSSPAQVASSESFAMVVAGGAYTCGLTRAGRALCWGRGQDGQLGTGTPHERLTPTAVRTSEEFVTLAAGEHHACGLTKTGQVLCWGANARGELGTGAATGSLLPSPAGELRP